MLPNLSEEKKCEYLYLHCRSGSMAEDWYENPAPLSPARHTSTTTTSGITGPAYGPVFVHHAPIDSPRDSVATVVPRRIDPALTNPPPPALDLDPYDPTFDTPAPSMDIRPAPDSVLGSYSPAMSANHVPPANLVNNMPPRVPPMAPVHVDPVAIAATATGSNPATATLTGFAFDMLSCRRAASLWLVCFRGGFRRFQEDLERIWIANEDVRMLRGGTCDSELGSYPGQGRQVSGVLAVV